MKTVRILVLVINATLCLGQVQLPAPANLVSSELSDSKSMTTREPNILGNPIVTTNLLSLPTVYKNIGIADVNGDGVPDLCFLDSLLSAIPILKCALGSLDGQFNIQFAAPTVWDADVSSLFPGASPGDWRFDNSRIQFVDLNGDGKADVCLVGYSNGSYPYTGRDAFGVGCELSNGSGFVHQSFHYLLFSVDQWDQFVEVDAVRFADVNHDGKIDVCWRTESGINCALSYGSGFGLPRLWSVDFNDWDGWGTDPAYYSTIQFADVNGDGLPDVCGRSPAGITCALNTGHSFLRSWLWTSQFSDADGWNKPQYYSTIHFGDINGDGKDDVCGRGTVGIYCARSGGVFFGDASTVQVPEFSDANGWNQEPNYRSLWLVDVNNDGKADICARGYLGIWCALSTATYDPSFGPLQLWVANFGDNFGWGTHDYYWGTVRPIYAWPNQGGLMTAFCGRGGAGIWCSKVSFRPTL